MNQTNKTIFSVPNSSELEQLTELHKAMGDYTRMKILWHLMKQEYCVSELAKKIEVTESAISHQLHELRIARLVRSRKEGKKVFYSIQDEHIQWILEETYAHISERYQSVIFCGQFNTCLSVSFPAPTFCYCSLCFPYFLPAFWAIL